MIFSPLSNNVCYAKEKVGCFTSRMKEKSVMSSVKVDKKGYKLSIDSRVKEKDVITQSVRQYVLYGTSFGGKINITVCSSVSGPQKKMIHFKSVAKVSGCNELTHVIKTYSGLESKIYKW